MSIGEWVYEHPKTDIAVGAVAATAAILSRGRLSEAFMRGAEDVVKAGTIKLQEGVTAQRIGNNMRIMADDGFTVDVTRGLFGKYAVQAKLPDASAVMTLNKNGATVRAEGAVANLRGYSLAARMDGEGLIRRDYGSYGAPTVSKGQFTFEGRKFSGNNFNLWVDRGNIRDWDWQTRGGMFGGREFLKFTNKNEMTNVNGSLQLTPYENDILIRHDGIILGDGQKVTPWNEFARRFEKRV
jgi:hypothetical protein